MISLRLIHWPVLVLVLVVLEHHRAGWLYPYWHRSSSRFWIEKQRNVALKLPYMHLGSSAHNVFLSLPGLISSPWCYYYCYRVASRGYHGVHGIRGAARCVTQHSVCRAAATALPNYRVIRFSSGAFCLIQRPPRLCFSIWATLSSHYY